MNLSFDWSLIIGGCGQWAGCGAGGAHLGDLAQAEAHRGAGDVPEENGDHEEPVREQATGMYTHHSTFERRQEF